MISLKELCLASIVEEFERLYLAFLVSTDETYKRNFTFLQRKYSYELLNGLCWKLKIKQEYLDFLLNEHLTCLDKRWFEEDFQRKYLKDFFCRLPNLTQVSFYETNDEILEKIARYCPKIVEIDARRSSVTDDGVKYFCKNQDGIVPCPELKSISINSSKVTDASLILLLESLPFLEKIDHRNIPRILYSLHKENLHDFEKLISYNLVYLNLFGFSNLKYYTDLLKLCLIVCPKLKTISCIITDKKQLELFKHPSLENVSFEKYNMILMDLNNFLKVNGLNLISLRADDSEISVNVLAESCPKLESLTLYKWILSYNQDFLPLNFRYLRKCHFLDKRFNNISTEALRLLLSNAPNLEDLSFSFCHFPLNSEIYILKNSEKNKLKSISFYGCSVVSSIIKNVLLSCPILESLSLDNCNFSPHEIEELNDFISEMPDNRPNIYSNGYHFDEYNFYF